MSTDGADPLWKLMGTLFRAHPWHGVPIGSEAPAVVTCYIELVPSNTIKYELDKSTGHLKVDRPQRYSNVSPTPYGLIPQTFSGDAVAALCEERTGRSGIVGDGDPLDVCVLTEKDITQSDILLQAYPVGGLRMIDGSEADDKIIAVMQGDAVYGSWRDISECPARVLDRLMHYFLTYKEAPEARKRECEITHVYGREEAYEVIARSQEDYKCRFGDLESTLTAALRGGYDLKAGAAGALPAAASVPAQL